MPLDPAVPDLTRPAPANVRMQRADARAEVSVVHARGQSRLARLFQSGGARILLPRTHAPVPEAVTVNTAGGIAGGDRLGWGFEAGTGASLVATSQAAERVYRSSGETARVETRVRVGAGGMVAWLPQETILFDGARLARTLTVELTGDARATALEMLILGRRAMGERMGSGALSDRWLIHRDGRLVHAEALRLGGDIAARTAGTATLAGGRALATLVHAAPGADLVLDAARRLLATSTPEAVVAAATAKPDLLVLRWLAPDAHPLRTALVRFLASFRHTPLPRAWSSS